MCGSATHPGGGIMGAPGRIAALALLKERARPAGARDLAARYDAVVIGAGHNGLVTAPPTSPRPAGRSWCSSGAAAGGAAEHASSRRRPRASLVHTVGRLRTSVVRDLELARHGLELIEPEVRAFAPQPDGAGITF